MSSAPEPQSTFGHGFYTLPVAASRSGIVSKLALTKLTKLSFLMCFSANSNSSMNLGSVFLKTA